MHPRDRDDLLKLVARLRSIEAQDDAKASVCRELLEKLGQYVPSAASVDQTLAAPGASLKPELTSQRRSRRWV